MNEMNKIKGRKKKQNYFEATKQLRRRCNIEEKGKENR